MRCVATASLALAAAITLAACSGSNASANALGGNRPLVGTWRASEYQNPRAQDSARVFPFGRPPHGYLVYDRTGHVFFQVEHNLAAARGRWHQADSASLTQLLSNAAAYFGTYRPTTLEARSSTRSRENFRRTRVSPKSRHHSASAAIRSSWEQTAARTGDSFGFAEGGRGENVMGRMRKIVRSALTRFLPGWILALISFPLFFAPGSFVEIGRAQLVAIAVFTSAVLVGHTVALLLIAPRLRADADIVGRKSAVAGASRSAPCSLHRSCPTVCGHMRSSCSTTPLLAS